MLREMHKALRFGYSLLEKRLVHLHMQILYACNFKCRICHFWKDAHAYPARMKVSQARAIAEKIEALAPLVVCLGGGEPMIHRELDKIVRLFARRHYLSMVTNGWFVTPHKARALFAAGMQQVCVSLDHIDPKRHDELRGIEGAHARAISALKHFSENRVHPSQRVHMISVVMDDNIDDIEPLIRLSQKLGVTYLVNMYSSHRGLKETRVSGKLADYLVGLKRKYRNFVSLQGYLEGFTEAATAKKGITPCYAGRGFFNIDSQGNVGLCIDRMAEPVGNILSEELPVLRRKLLDMYRQNECGDCWTSCRGNIEPLLYGKHRRRELRQGLDFLENVPLGERGADGREGMLPEYQY